MCLVSRTLARVTDGGRSGSRNSTATESDLWSQTRRQSLPRGPVVLLNERLRLAKNTLRCDPPGGPVQRRKHATEGNATRMPHRSPQWPENVSSAHSGSGFLYSCSSRGNVGVIPEDGTSRESGVCEKNGGRCE